MRSREHAPRALFVTLAVVTVAGLHSVAGAAPAGRFDDDNGNVHEPMIEAVAAEGVTQGCGPRQYCPSELVSRAQLAGFLSRALELPPASRDYFPDDAGSVHEDAINRLAEAGIAAGSAFRPTDPTLRSEMAAFLTRGLELGPAPRDFFADDNGHPDEDAINRLAHAGITTGCGGLDFCPNGPVARDQFASFLGRALGLVALPPGSTVLEGSGDAVPQFIKPEPGPAIAVITYTSTEEFSHFAVIERDENGERGDLLVNELGDRYEGTVLIDAPLFDDGDTRAFEVTADGSWRIVVMPLSAAPRFAGPVSGRGDSVLVYTGQQSIARLTHNGSSNFAVWSYGSGPAELVVNEIGSYDGVNPFPRGERIIEINADGDWTITPQ